jgi:choline dehydrogenase-like flavoprotein
MIDDALRVPTGTTLAPDLCIVGAGAAGITLALQFARGGASVLLLESGGRAPEAATQALYEGEVADARLHAPAHRYRARVFGGSTTIWGGRCTPLEPVDFEPNAGRPHGAWPIASDALDPYWAEANRLCEAGDPHYTAAAALPGGAPMVEGFAGAHFSADTLERFSCPTDFGARYGHRLDASPHVRVLLHANVTELRLAADGRRLEQLAVRTLAGGAFTVRPRACVLAAGGLETPRLLLASRGAAHPRGVGNTHDLVGRYYMCHLAGTLGTVRFAPRVRVAHGYERSDDGVYCRRRFALQPEARRRLRLPGFAARLHHPRIPDPAHGSGALSLLYLARPLIPWEYARRLHDGGAPGAAAWLRHAGNVLRDLPATAAFGLHLLRERRLADRKFPSIVVQPRHRVYSLDVHAEQEPDADSRVTLLEHARDALGMPRLRIDWRYTARDVDGVRRALALLAEDFARSGVGTLEHDAAAVEGELTRYGAYGGHHIGTARMGTDPRRSVVDRDCRVHGLENLYIAGSAVFPTSSQANPTLPLVALTLRLAAHLKDALAAPAARNSAGWVERSETQHLPRAGTA